MFTTFLLIRFLISLRTHTHQVTVYTEVAVQAKLMMGTMLPFIFVQTVAFVGTVEQTQLACLYVSYLPCTGRVFSKFKLIRVYSLLFLSA